jgi:ribosomal protein S18 acetylase RimI-like enzyme
MNNRKQYLLLPANAKKNRIEVRFMDDRYSIRDISEVAIEESGALRLIWSVFLEFEAPEYSDEGIREFKDFIAPEAIKQRLLKKLFCWGCFDNEKIVGVIATRPPCHIALLFVDKEHHRQGIARKLFNTAIDFYKRKDECHEMTVNSSPYAVEAYRRLGFIDTGTAQVINGIRFVPMKCEFK